MHTWMSYNINLHSKYVIMNKLKPKNYAFLYETK